MSPWDELTYVRPLVYTLTTLSVVGTPQKFVSSNQMRVALIISTTATAGIMSIQPDLGSTPPGGQLGIGIANTSSLVFNVHDHPGLTQSGWWFSGTMAGAISSTEVLLKEWPPEPGVASDVNLIRVLASLIRAIKGEQ